MPCTTILVGKDASYNGSTLMARNEDSGSKGFSPKKFIVVKPEDQPKVYKAVLSQFTMTLPKNPMKYTCMPNALDTKGIWGEAGFNEENVAMSATETITSNSRVLSADPLVKNGFGEEDMVTIILPYIHSAREGVLYMGKLLEKYGTYELNAVAFQDKDEIWWMETIGGHHYIARRVPDDCYVVGPNQQGIDTFDFTDAFGKQENYLCSDDLLNFILENNLDMSFHDEVLIEMTEFDVRATFGSHSDSDRSYNTCRAWYMAKTLNPHTFKWEGEFADYTPESFDIPWCFVPEHKINIEDIKYVLSSHYQGTEYNSYNSHTTNGLKGKYRPIGINRNSFCAITEIRPDLPKEIAAVEWISVASNIFNSSFPFYANIEGTPSYLRDVTKDVDTHTLYWTNRLIAALCDKNFRYTKAVIENYQEDTLTEGHWLLKQSDAEYLEQKPENVTEFCEKANQKVSDYAQKATQDLLNEILDTASFQMISSFNMDDA